MIIKPLATLSSSLVILRACEKIACHPEPLYFGGEGSPLSTFNFQPANV
jgi:hypothetical protein